MRLQDKVAFISGAGAAFLIRNAAADSKATTS